MWKYSGSAPIMAVHHPPVLCQPQYSTSIQALTAPSINYQFTIYPQDFLQKVNTDTVNERNNKYTENTYALSDITIFYVDLRLIVGPYLCSCQFNSTPFLIVSSAVKYLFGKYF